MRVSIVVPVHNECKTLETLVERIADILPDYQVVFVDDGSCDDSWLEICRLSENSNRIFGLRLKGNMGQHQATICGLGFATGDAVVTMDGDLQHRPEDIPSLLGALGDEVDIAIGRFTVKQHTRQKNLGSRFKNVVEHSVFDLPSGLVMSGFKAMKPVWASKLAKVTGTKPYLPSYLYRWPCRLANVEVRHERRQRGSSNYGLLRSARFGTDVLLSDPKIPKATFLGGLLVGSALYKRRRYLMSFMTIAAAGALLLESRRRNSDLPAGAHIVETVGL